MPFPPRGGAGIGSKRGGLTVLKCKAPRRAFLTEGRVVLSGNNLDDRPGANTLWLPCGQCVFCRLKWARGWALRCAHEASLRPENSFLTLTYSDDKMPYAAGNIPSLRKDDFALFLKRLRFSIAPRKVRFLQAGEYSPAKMRPHHHALLFGFWPADAQEWKRVGSYWLYRSDFLNDLWGHGHVWVGHVSFESAGYVAQYALKKVTGKGAADAYGPRQRPFMTMSRRPGIGFGWLEQYADEVFPHGSVMLENGSRAAAPPYYMGKFKSADPEAHASLIDFRRAAILAEQSTDLADLRDGQRSLRAAEANLRARLSLRGGRNNVDAQDVHGA